MMKKGKTVKAAAAVILSVCMLTGCADALKNGTKALENGKYEEAQDYFRAASKDKDKDKAAEAYRGLGIAYFESEDYGDALEAFDAAISSGAEQTVQIYNLMGICAEKQSSYEDGLEYFQAGLALAQKESSEKKFAELIQEMRFNEIVCLEKTADWDNAKKKIDEYLKDYPDDKDAQKEAEFLETR